MRTPNQVIIHGVTAISIKDQDNNGEFWSTNLVIKTKSGDFLELSLFSSRSDQPIAILCDHAPDGSAQLDDDEIEKLLDEKSKLIDLDSLCDHCLEPLSDDGHCSRCEADPEALEVTP